ncbi:hypothetical protein SNOG_14597 [Parastagonospora nodorum SN15]|nr:hypothetical protein SNOG_14597 [Parastagonospora nodorum SN15]EAT78137.1 hypothetical protein SNOG_14597 [Parastagonospora nodorum SN15]
MSPSGLSSGNPTPLKPLYGHEEESFTGYQHRGLFEDHENIKVALNEDAILKARIRRLRVISRVLAFLISVGVLIPITMTLAKYLGTKDTFRTIVQDGQTIERTAWAKNTRAWPTWMYFAIAALSALLNFGTVFSYRFGVETANAANYVTSAFSWIVILGNFVVWSVAAGMYRGEKDKDGKSNDLWGWTCSAGARAIQKEFAGDVNFDRFCNVQSVSWYIGLVQAGAALLTVVIYILVLMRRRSKKNLDQQLRVSGFEPGRHG